MSNILKVPHQHVIHGLIAKGWSIRRIARSLVLNRRTVRRYAATASSKCATEVIAGPVPPDPPKCTTEVIAGSGPPDQPKCTTQTQVIAGSRSLCGGFREVIAPMLELGLSAQRIYQDLVAGHGFAGSYPSVSRYVAKLTHFCQYRTANVFAAM